MIEPLSRGSGVLDEVAAASFLLSLGWLAAGLLTTGAAVVVVAEVGGATAVPGVAAGCGAVAAAEVATEAVVDTVAELTAESAAVPGV